MVVFVYVCLEVANFSTMFTCGDSIEPIRYGCVMCMWGMGVGLLQVVPSFAIWSVILLSKILSCALTFCIVMLCLVHRI